MNTKFNHDAPRKLRAWLSHMNPIVRKAFYAFITSAVSGLAGGALLAGVIIIRQPLVNAAQDSQARAASDRITKLEDKGTKTDIQLGQIVYGLNLLLQKFDLPLIQTK